MNSIVIRCWAWIVNQTGGELMLSNSGRRARERVADELCAGAECFARLGFVGEAEKDRYVAGRLRNRAGTDRVEAAELWRRSEVTTSYASKEVLLSPQCAGRSAIRTASPIWTLASHQ